MKQPEKVGRERHTLKKIRIALLSEEKLIQEKRFGLGGDGLKSVVEAGGGARLTNTVVEEKAEGIKEKSRASRWGRLLGP